MIVLRFCMRGLGLVSTIVLARLLIPEDFGLVALAMVLVGATEALTTFNFDIALIRDQQATRAHYDTAWTLGVLRGLIVGLVLVALAEPAALFFNEPRVTQIVYALAFVNALEGFNNVGTVDFRKNLQFDKDAWLLLWPNIAGFVVTLGLAFAWRNYWALVAGTVISRVLRLLASYAVHPYRPRFNLSEWRDIVSFSSWLLIGNIINFIYVRIDTVIIGRIAGAPALGIYTMAYDLANVVTTDLVAPIRRALLPGYAKMAQDAELLSRSFIDIWAITLAVAAPMAIGIGLVADPLVRVILGAKWIDCIVLIQILSLYGLFSITTVNVAPVFQAMGKPRVPALLLGLSALISTPVLYYAVLHHGLRGAAIAVTVTNGLFALLTLSVTASYLRLRASLLLRAIWRTACSVTVMAAAVSAMSALRPENASFVQIAAELFGSIAGGALVYITVHYCLWRLSGCPAGPEQQLLAVLNLAIRRLRSKPSAT